MKREAEIETDLEEFGRRWRALQPTLPQYGLDRRRTRQGQYATPIGGLLAASAVLAFALLLQTRGSDLPKATALGAGAPPASAIVGDSPGVQDGDVVTAVGRIVLPAAGETPVLCHLSPTRAPYVPDLTLKCDDPQVAITALDLPSLPGWRRVGSSWASQTVRVTGKWISNALRADDVAVEANPAPPFSVPSHVPCPGPDGGWAGGVDLEAMEAATAQLEAEIASAPELFAGSWWVDATTSRGARTKVVVVGTVGDVKQVEEALRVVYPYDLCVVHVAHSTAGLEATANEIRESYEGWRVTVWPPSNRVIVQPVVGDANTLAVLAAYDGRVSVHPLVIPAS